MPGTLRHLGLRVQPRGQQLELACLDAPLLDPVEEVLEQGRGDSLAPNAGHGSDSVEAPGEALSKGGRFLRVADLGELLGQDAQLRGA